MKKIPPEHRRVVNIDEAAFADFSSGNGDSALQINGHDQLGVGFHIYRMPPGTHTTPHEHMGDEEFLVLEGELTDNDGFTYKRGDLVWLKQGTQHSSYSKQGCLLAVYIAAPERNLEP